MYVQKIYSQPVYKYQNLSQYSDSTTCDTPKIGEISGYYYHPVEGRNINFRGGLYGRELEAVKGLYEECTKFMKPVRKSFCILHKDYLTESYNRFYNNGCREFAIKTDETPHSLLFNDLFGELDGWNFSVAPLGKKEKFLRLGYQEPNKDWNYLYLKDENIFKPENLNKPLSSVEISDLNIRSLLRDIVPEVSSQFQRFNDFVNITINENISGYTAFLCKSVLKKIKDADSILNSIEHEKRFALKQSYSKYVPFPGKSSVYWLKESDATYTNGYAFVPHRNGDMTTFRMLQFDSNGAVSDAYLVDIKKGIYKNYCKKRIYNNATLNHTPINKDVMNTDEVKKSNIVEYLEKYYSALEDFITYVQKNKDISSEKILNQSDANHFIPYNKLKQQFADRVALLLKILDKDEISLTGKNGTKYCLRNLNENGRQIYQLDYDNGYREQVVKFDVEKSKILGISIKGEYLKDKNGMPVYYPHTAMSYSLRSKVLKDFITEAYEQVQFSKDEDFITQLTGLKNSFENVYADWMNVSRTKRVIFNKEYENLVSAKGDIGGLRFKITGEDYQIGLKPHQLKNNEFMRLTIYDNDGNIKNAFLIKEYGKIVDNYCSVGNFTKDAISRVPDKIVYKTDEQIQQINLPKYIAEYIGELEKFKHSMQEKIVDKRLKTE